MRSCDVVVIGGGPAGSTIAAFLAEKGWDVQVLEKSRHPRFHIGESLLPYSIPYLQRLGVLDEVEEIGLKKYGSEIISPYYGKALTFRFSEVEGARYIHAYQVMRSELDEILFQNCARKGATVNEGVTVTRVNFKAHGPVVAANHQGNGKQQWKARFVVDASGRDALLSQQLSAKQRNFRHNSAAVFSHFAGVQRHTGDDEGNITLCWFDWGWFWLIPLKGGIASVGAVCAASYFKSRSGTLDDLFWQAAESCPPIVERLEHATQLRSTQAAGNYSYRSRIMSGDRFIIVGDAWAFIDPVFSSGVHLAFHSASLGAEVVDAYLSGRTGHKKRVRDFEREVHRGLSAFSWLIYHFNQPAFQYLLMHPRNLFGMKDAVLSIMAGNVFDTAKPFLPILLFRLFYYITVALTPKRTLRARWSKPGKPTERWDPEKGVEVNENRRSSVGLQITKHPDR